MIRFITFILSLLGAAALGAFGITYIYQELYGFNPTTKSNHPYQYLIDVNPDYENYLKWVDESQDDARWLTKIKENPHGAHALLYINVLKMRANNGLRPTNI